MKLILRVYLPSQRLLCMGQSEEQETRPWKLSSSRIGLDFVPKYCPIVFFKFWSIRLIRNRMAFSGNFGKIDPRFYFEVFRNRPNAVRAISKNFKMNLGLFIPNCPQTHAITNTNCFAVMIASPWCMVCGIPRYLHVVSESKKWQSVHPSLWNYPTISVV